MSFYENRSSLVQQYPSETRSELLASLNAFLAHENVAEYFASFAASESDELLGFYAAGLFHSGFIQEQLHKNSQWIVDWGAAVLRPDSFTAEYWSHRIEYELQHQDSNKEFETSLRKLRQEAMTCIYLRDISGISDLLVTMGAVTALADVCIQSSVSFLYDEFCTQYGTPRDEENNEVRFVVLTMGKLGARELNLSSDIDLIFTYPKSGWTDHSNRPLDNQLFFQKLATKLISLLDKRTEYGFVFRVDLRLRPYGASGAIVHSFDALEHYLQSQGRPWERFAMTKARALCGSSDDRQRVMDVIHPFVYRRYTDFSLIQSLRDIKGMIALKNGRTSNEGNIKLGRGGIRDIEFVVQACQLVHGGRDRSLRRSDLLGTLSLLGKKRYLPEAWVSELNNGYRFLRDLEHRIQGLDDQQTQSLPPSAPKRTRLAHSMGFRTWHELINKLAEVQEKISKIFDAYLSPSRDVLSDGSDSADSAGRFLALWHQRADDIWLEGWKEELARLGYESSESCLASLKSLKECRAYNTLSSEGLQRFERFLPLLLEITSKRENPDGSITRMLTFIQKVLGRSIYLVLLYENPQALKQLCILFSRSQWLSEIMAATPVVIDELLDMNVFRQLPCSKESLADELRQQLLRIPEEDVEEQLNCLRDFKQGKILKIAAAELNGSLPLTEASDLLSWLAEVILNETMWIATRDLGLRCGDGAIGRDGGQGSGFAVIAYGKLGSGEMGYTSDLDLVFLHQGGQFDSAAREAALAGHEFFIKLGKKLITLLSSLTSQGKLYEVDMRLRPSGNSGLLVTSISAFRRYQMQDAWTWEHQALVRARFICGDPALEYDFNHVRREALSKTRDGQMLRAEISSMRQKIYGEWMKNSPQEKDDIKRGKGGLIDVEFIVQYLVLAFGPNHPKLLNFRSNIRILEQVKQFKILEPSEADHLIDAYHKYRSALNRNKLEGPDLNLSLGGFAVQRERVLQSWRALISQD